MPGYLNGSLITVLKNIIVAALVCATFLVYASGESLCSSGYLTVVDTETGYKCVPCSDLLKCPRGQGLSVSCDTTVRSDVEEHCIPCSPGKTYSSTYDRIPCQPCKSSKCLPHEIVYGECTVVKDNTVCSGRCEQCYSMNANQTCVPIDPLCRKDEYITRETKSTPDGLERTGHPSHSTLSSVDVGMICVAVVLVVLLFIIIGICYLNKKHRKGRGADQESIDDVERQGGSSSTEERSCENEETKLLMASKDDAHKDLQLVELPSENKGTPTSSDAESLSLQFENYEAPDSLSSPRGTPVATQMPVSTKMQKTKSALAAEIKPDCEVESTSGEELTSKKKYPHGIKHPAMVKFTSGLNSTCQLKIPLAAKAAPVANPLPKVKCTCEIERTEVESTSEVKVPTEVDPPCEVEDLPEDEPTFEVKDLREVGPTSYVNDLQAVESTSEVKDLTEAESISEINDFSDVEFISEVKDFLEPTSDVESVPEVKSSSKVNFLPEVDSTVELRLLPERETTARVKRPPQVKPPFENELPPEVNPSVKVNPLLDVQSTSKVKPPPEVKPASELKCPLEVGPPDEVELSPEVEPFHQVKPTECKVKSLRLDGMNPDAFRKLCQLFDKLRPLGGDYVTLAAVLNYAQQDVNVFELHSPPTKHILEDWGCRPGNTVLQLLKIVSEEMKRGDVLDLLKSQLRHEACDCDDCHKDITDSLDTS